MDLGAKKSEDLQSRRRAIEFELNNLTQQVFEMDQKIRQYLADRQKHAHPRHQEFIDKVQRYRISPAISNKHLEMILDNLQWKIYYYQRAWKQMWDNADAAYRQGRTPDIEKTAPPEQREEPAAVSEAGEEEDTQAPKAKSQYSIESLWAIQQMYGADPDETKEKFKKRIFQEYNQLITQRKPGQEIIMTYDEEDKKCRLDLKGKTSSDDQ